ncbi:hypothetical protein V5O48_005138 [Marasmius crinis-equi]|uniref:Transcobalamin-like C-terminal domain-containing protein n=1 Tax=Marasmius crinis-equi TaxID=585013 RepID=A0ABR3FN90_9AGAR
MLMIAVLFSLAFLSRGLTVIFARPLESSSAVSHNKLAFVKLRIEGAQKTIFEGRILTFGHRITTPSGGTHKCDGTNNDANPKPGPTCTTALFDAGKIHGFDFDGTFDTTFDDYFITSIGGDAQTSTQFWGLLVNYQFAPTGGCQSQVSSADEILWAFDAFSKNHFLKLEAPITVKKGTSAQLKVTDGMTGAPVSGATVEEMHGSNTAAIGTSTDDGYISVDFPHVGVYTFKASKDDSIRSNGVAIIVTP